MIQDPAGSAIQGKRLMGRTNQVCREYVEEVNHCLAMDCAVDQYAATSKTMVPLRMRTVTRHDGVIEDFR